MNDLNTDRQRITKEVQQQAADLVIASGKDAHNILVVDGADFPAGIVGLVAARLAERFHRPALLIERGETISRGSARSIKDFSIIEALTECGDLFEKFGGHAAAAGFSIRNDRLAELEQRLIAIGKRDITPAMLTPRLDYDGELQLGTLSAELVDHLGMLEPFGHGNGEPLWVSHGVQVVEARTMGGENQHLKLKLAHGHHQSIEAVWWRQGEHLAALSRRPKVDIAYTLEINTWNNRRSVQLKLKDLRLI